MIAQNLRTAARLAREASQGRRTIEIVVTEDGIVVRGWTNIAAERRYSGEWKVDWFDLSSPADLASNAVMLVDRQLSAVEGAAA